MSECPATGTGSDTASGCAVGVPAASDDGTGRTGFADAVGPVVDAVVAGEGERAAPGIRVAVAFAGDVRAADSGERIAEDAQTVACISFTTSKAWGRLMIVAACWDMRGAPVCGCRHHREYPLPA